MYGWVKGSARAKVASRESLLYYCRQFFERPIFTLSGEVGFAYVTEDFIVAEDQDYPGAHWEVNLTSDYLGGDSRMYIEQSGIWNLKDTGDIVK